MLDSLFNKATADLQLTNLFKKKLQHKCFPANFAEFIKATLVEHLLQLLLFDAQSITFITY